jgi:hypothetical protein
LPAASKPERADEAVFFLAVRSGFKAGKVYRERAGNQSRIGRDARLLMIESGDEPVIVKYSQE